MNANEIIEKIAKLELMADIKKIKEYCDKEIEIRFNRYLEGKNDI